MQIPNSPAVRIIDYDDKYARETVQMWRDSKEKALGIKDIHTFEEHLHFLRKTLVRENKVYLAIDNTNDQAVGILAIKGVEITEFYIHIDYQHRGIGTRFIKEAKRISPARLKLFTFEINTKARAFYEKHGFKAIGRGSDNEENLPHICYEWNG